MASKFKDYDGMLFLVSWWCLMEGRTVILIDVYIVWAKLTCFSDGVSIIDTGWQWVLLNWIVLKFLLDGYCVMSRTILFRTTDSNSLCCGVPLKPCRTKHGLRGCSRSCRTSGAGYRHGLGWQSSILNETDRFDGIEKAAIVLTTHPLRSIGQPGTGWVERLGYCEARQSCWVWSGWVRCFEGRGLDDPIGLKRTE